jgi:hypothetical protein
VPLYRENLLSGETSAVPIRLMGQDKFQRSSLTTNNNRYFIDTTPSLKVQDTPSGNFPINYINVFLPGKTYYVFLLFAKGTTTQTKAATKQTYDLYVGKGFDPADTNQLWLTRVELPSAYNFKKAGPIPDASQNVSYNSSTGVLSVTLDMSKIPSFGKDYSAAQKSQCQPKTFCQWFDNPGTGEDNCQCAGAIFSPPTSTFQAAECTQTNGICSWATKDVDCPEGGCYGFGVKLSSQFVASDTPPNPAPSTQSFPSGADSPWNAPFSSPVSTSDACYYPNPQSLFVDDPSVDDQ